MGLCHLRAAHLPAQWQFMYWFAQFVQSCLVGDGVLVVVIDCARASSEAGHVMMAAVTESGIIVF